MNRSSIRCCECRKPLLQTAYYHHWRQKHNKLPFPNDRMMRPAPRTAQDLILPPATVEEPAGEPDQDFDSGFQADFHDGAPMDTENDIHTNAFQLRRSELLSRASCRVVRLGHIPGKMSCSSLLT